MHGHVHVYIGNFLSIINKFNEKVCQLIVIIRVVFHYYVQRTNKKPVLKNVLDENVE